MMMMMMMIMIIIIIIIIKFQTCTCGEFAYIVVVVVVVVRPRDTVKHIAVQLDSKLNSHVHVRYIFSRSVMMCVQYDVQPIPFGLLTV